MNIVTQVDRLKAEDCWEKAHFEAMVSAKITFRQSTAIVFFRPLQPCQRYASFSLNSFSLTT